MMGGELPLAKGKYNPPNKVGPITLPGFIAFPSATVLRTAILATVFAIITSFACHVFYADEYYSMRRLPPPVTLHEIEQSLTRTMTTVLTDLGKSNVTSITLPGETNPLRSVDTSLLDGDTETTLYKRMLNTDYEAIMMGAMEVNCILRHLVNVDTYLEWGSGGSTVNFAKFVRKRVISIEHNAAWCKRVSELLDEDKVFAHVEYKCVPVRRGTMGWGIWSGFQEGWYAPFKKYIDKIDEVNQENFDMILVDGRARVSACVKSLAYLRNDSKLILHDSERIFDDKLNKEYGYRKVLEFYDIIEKVGRAGQQGVAILQRKPEFSYLQGNLEAVQQIIEDKKLR